MQHSHRSEALQSALQFVMTSDVPAQHKATLIEVLTDTLREDENKVRRQANVRDVREWREDEIERLKSGLRDRTARSWQHADECVMQLAVQLQRDPRSIRDKAVELGYKASVDYRFAKTLSPPAEE